MKKSIFTTLALLIMTTSVYAQQTKLIKSEEWKSKNPTSGVSSKIGQVDQNVLNDSRNANVMDKFVPLNDPDDVKRAQYEMANNPAMRAYQNSGNNYHTAGRTVYSADNGQTWQVDIDGQTHIITNPTNPDAINQQIYDLNKNSTYATKVQDLLKENRDLKGYIDRYNNPAYKDFYGTMTQEAKNADIQNMQRKIDANTSSISQTLGDGFELPTDGTTRNVGWVAKSDVKPWATYSVNNQMVPVYVINNGQKSQIFAEINGKTQLLATDGNSGSTGIASAISQAMQQ